VKQIKRDRDIDRSAVLRLQLGPQFEKWRDRPDLAVVILERDFTRQIRRNGAVRLDAQRHRWLDYRLVGIVAGIGLGPAKARQWRRTAAQAADRHRRQEKNLEDTVHGLIPLREAGKRLRIARSLQSKAIARLMCLFRRMTFGKFVTFRDIQNGSDSDSMRSSRPGSALTGSTCGRDGSAEMSWALRKKVFLSYLRLTASRSSKNRPQ
jgi:hypothetical protein